MSADLKSPQRPPITYKREIRLPHGLPLKEFEAIAWRASELGIDLCLRLKGRQPNRKLAKVLRPSAEIQRQLIEQFGWPERA